MLLLYCCCNKSQIKVKEYSSIGERFLCVFVMLSSMRINANEWQFGGEIDEIYRDAICYISWVNDGLVCCKSREFQKFDGSFFFGRVFLKFWQVFLVTGVGRPVSLTLCDNEIPFTVLSTLHDAAFYSGFLFLDVVLSSYFRGRNLWARNYHKVAVFEIWPVSLFSLFFKVKPEFCQLCAWMHFYR